MIFDLSESDEPIFGTFRGPLITEVLLLIELSQHRIEFEAFRAIFAPQFRGTNVSGTIPTFVMVVICFILLPSISGSALE